tara:strand:- start:45 stop:383 length:339 start_codon:yes stop_codon:yes gene_type:complete
MDSINFAFILPGSDWCHYIPCHRCLKSWEDSDKQPKDIRRIRSNHNSCHGWNHCHIDCCGPCPYCGYCDGLDEWELDEDGDIIPENPEYSESKLKDPTAYTEEEWKQDQNYD